MCSKNSIVAKNASGTKIAIRAQSAFTSKNIKVDKNAISA